MYRSYFVYILKCSDGTYYNGITNDLDRRLVENEDGIDLNSYTSKRRPVELKLYYQFDDVNQAIAFEKQVKKWPRKKKEAIINDQWDLLPELSKSKKSIKE